MKLNGRIFADFSQLFIEGVTDMATIFCIAVGLVIYCILGAVYYAGRASAFVECREMLKDLKKRVDEL